MPDKPIWYARLETAIRQLEALPSPWIDRASLELALGVGRRRAQQILQPLVRLTIGKNGLADRDDVIRYLRDLAAGQTADFEKQRRQRLHSILDQLRLQARDQPRVLVEAPAAVVNQELDNLPPGVHLSPGRIILDSFSTPQEAKQKLLALIMAMGNDPDGFDARIRLL
jgi:uncharacterized protein YbjT (DUF2867 family)